MRWMARKSGLLFALIYGLMAMPAHTNSLPPPVLTGSWGGQHIRLDITQAGATVEYDCAMGSIHEPLVPDENGKFEARGTYVFEPGGPYHLGEPPLKEHPALYRGWTNGSEMRLTVILLDTGAEAGTFSLGLGREPMLEKCL